MPAGVPEGMSLADYVKSRKKSDPKSELPRKVRLKVKTKGLGIKLYFRKLKFHLRASTKVLKNRIKYKILSIMLMKLLKG